MKNVLINCSPKKNLSASEYLMSLQSLFLKGEKVIKKLKNKSDYMSIFKELNDADSLILYLPLYADGVPSHVLSFLENAEHYFLKKNFQFNLYCVANNGFIEGRQNKPLMLVLENFCHRAGINWCGGIGIGGGVMLNIIRIVFIVQTVILFIHYSFAVIQTGLFWSIKYLLLFLQNAVIFLFFHLVVLYFLITMAMAINKKSFFGKHYTRALIPSFLFVCIANIFFIILSFFKGGLFKGWLTKK